MNRIILIFFTSFLICQNGMTQTTIDTNQRRSCCDFVEPNDAVTPNHVPWENGIIPYTFNPSADKLFQNQINSVLATLENELHLVFVDRETEPRYIDFIPATSNRTGASNTGRNPIHLFDRSYGTVAHEVLHALGHFHEQRRPDRTNWSDFNVLELHTSDEHNWRVFKPLISSTPYDFSSIMQYPYNGGAALGLGINVQRPHSQYYRRWPFAGGEVLTKSDLWGYYERYQFAITFPTGFPGTPRPFELESPQYGELITPGLTAFDWSDSALMLEYEIEIADTPTFSNIIASTTSSTSDVVIDTTLLPSGIPLFWRAVAVGPTASTQAIPLETHPFCLGSSLPENVYIDANNTSPTDGSSWPNAFNSLQVGMYMGVIAESNSSPLTVHIAEGVYDTSYYNEILSDPYDCFHLTGYTTYLGGYGDINNTPTRSPTLYTTTLDASNSSNATTPLIAAYSVQGNTVLDGVTLTCSTLRNKLFFSTNSNTTFTNIIFSSSAQLSNSIISTADNSTFLANSLLLDLLPLAQSSPANPGSETTILELFDTDFRIDNLRMDGVNSNTSTFYFGNFINIYGSRGLFANTAIVNINEQAFPMFGSLINVETIRHPDTSSSDISSDVQLINSLIAENGLFSANLISMDTDSTLSLVNTAVWGNSANTLSPTVVATYTLSDIPFSGAGNIDATSFISSDIFMDSSSGNFSPSPYGPLIDAANASSLPDDIFDLDDDTNTNETIPVDLLSSTRQVQDFWVSDVLSTLDIGPFESQTQSCPVDFIADGNLNFLDFTEFNLLYSMMDSKADLNEDGNFNFSDISIFLNLYSKGCP